MSFVYKNFGVLAGSTNANGALMDWSYISDTDTVATIIASNYFLELCENLENPLIAVGQKIWIKGSDGYAFVYFSSVSDSAVAVAPVPQAGFIALKSAIYTTAGGSATEVIAAPGVLATDVVLVTLRTPGATPVTVVRAVTATDQISVVFSANPSTDTIINYVVIRV